MYSSQIPLALPSNAQIEEAMKSFLNYFLKLFYYQEKLQPASKSQKTEGILHQELLTVFLHLLENEIRKSLICRRKSDETEKNIKIILCELQNRLPSILEILFLDIDAIFEGDPAATCKEEIILAYPGIQAMAAQRIAHQLYQLNVPLIPRMLTEWAHTKTGIDIHPGAKIGKNFCIDHGTGIVIGETCEIGDHVKIYHGVTLGAKSTAKGRGLIGTKRHPTIGSHVTLYPGVTILGGDTVIGEGCTIGGNVFLMQSVPPYHVVYHQEEALSMKPKQNH